MIVREQDILKKDPPNGGTWTEENIRAYQESKGINYGGTVYCRGVKPNREWSNTSFDSSNAVETQTPQVSEIDRLRARIKELETPSVPSITETVENVTHGVDRHGLDKRSKEYRESIGR